MPSLTPLPAAVNPAQRAPHNLVPIGFQGLDATRVPAVPGAPAVRNFLQRKPIGATPSVRGRIFRR